MLRVLCVLHAAVLLAAANIISDSEKLEIENANNNKNRAESDNDNQITASAGKVPPMLIAGLVVVLLLPLVFVVYKYIKNRRAGRR